MRKSFLLLLTCFGAIAAVSAVRAEDSLFSRYPINSVFVPPGSSPTNPAGGSGATQPQQPQRLLGAPAISDLLQQAGFEAKGVSDEVVSTKVQFGTWSFPVLVTTSDDHQQLHLVLLLTVVKDGKQLSTEKLLELMNASRQHSPAHFAFSTQRKRIELYRTLENEGLTPNSIKTEINRLAEIANQTQNLWNIATAKGPDTAKTGSQATPAPQTGAAPVASNPPQASQSAPAARSAPSTRPAAAGKSALSILVGKWTAKRSAKEAFAMELKADGTFVLIHIAQEKKTRSSGKFSLSGRVLTLTGSDGKSLAGNVSSKSNTEFQFLPTNTSSKAYSLNFKRAT